MKVSGQLPAPADLPWERNLIKIRQVAGWAPKRVSMLLNKERFAPGGIRASDSPARNLDAISTTRCKYYFGTSILQTSETQCRGVNTPLTNFKLFIA